MVLLSSQKVLGQYGHFCSAMRALCHSEQQCRQPSLAGLRRYPIQATFRLQNDPVINGGRGVHSRTFRLEAFDQSRKCSAQLAKGLGAIDRVLHDGVRWKIKDCEAGASLRRNQRSVIKRWIALFFEAYWIGKASSTAGPSRARGSRQRTGLLGHSRLKRTRSSPVRRGRSRFFLSSL